MAPDAKDLQGKWTPSPPWRLSIQCTGNQVFTSSPHTFVPAVLRISKCRAMNPLGLHLGHMSVQVRLIIRHASRYLLYIVSRHYLEEQLSARERKKKETDIPVQLCFCGAESIRQTFYVEKPGIRVWVEPYLTSVFYLAFTLMDIFSLRVCHDLVVCLILWWMTL